MQLVTVIVKLRISSRLRELVWVGASPPWRRGPQVRAALASWGHGAVDVVGPVTPPGRAIGRGDSQECTQISENGPLEPFWSVCVHFCDASFATRAASGGTSAPTAMACRRRPLGGRLPLGRKTASARAAPPLAWCLRRGSNPHKPPERHIFPEPQIRRGFGSIRG